MSGRQLRSLGMALALAALLGFAGAQPVVAEAKGRVVPARQVGLLDQVWDWLAGWIGGQGRGGNQGLARLWAEEGMGLDPDGAHLTAPPASGGSTVSGDSGFGLDPNGGH